MDKKFHTDTNSDEDDVIIISEDNTNTKYTLPRERSLLPSMLDFMPAQSTRSQVKRRYSVHNPVDIGKLSLWDKPASTIFKTPIGLAPRPTAKTETVSTVAQKKPLTPFGKFFSETAVIAKKNDPNCTYEDVTRSATALWHALDPAEKQRYLNKTEEEHTELLQNLQQKSNAQIPKNIARKPKLVCPELDTVVISDDEDDNDGQNDSNGNLALKEKLKNLSERRSYNYNTTMLTQIQQCKEEERRLLQKAEMELFGECTTASEDEKEKSPTRTNSEMNLTDASATPICSRVGCNKRAIISHDWDDEYCSNECCIQHCRSEFSNWLVTNKKSSANARK